MEPFVQHTGKLALLPQSDVDTDQIIPARFLSMVTRTGYGELLFKDLRGGSFPLDDPQNQGATILAVFENFGCGSSREHAVWAIQQADFKAVIARTTESAAGFSDIFRMNAANNGLLLIELPKPSFDGLIAAAAQDLVSIDLQTQTLAADGWSGTFDIAPAAKDALINGLDLIGTTLRHEGEIADYEKTRGPWTPPKP